MSQLRAFKKSSLTSSNTSKSWPAPPDTGEVFGKAVGMTGPWATRGEPVEGLWGTKGIEYEDRSCSSKSPKTSECSTDAPCAAPEKCRLLGCVVHKYPQQRLSIPEDFEAMFAHDLVEIYEQARWKVTRRLLYRQIDAKWSALNEHRYLSNFTEKPERTAAMFMAETVDFALKILGLNKSTKVSKFLDTLENRPVPTRAEFRRLAKENPLELVAWVKGGTLDPTILTFAAEILGEVPDSELVVPCLMPLLGHPSSVVREGAIYGIENHLEWTGVKARLHEIAESDPREGVREAAREALS